MRGLDGNLTMKSEGNAMQNAADYLRRKTSQFDPQNDNLGGHADQSDHPKKNLEGQNDLLKEFVIARINETPTISREELADISNTSESTLKGRMKEWNIVWEGQSKMGHWVIPQ